MIKYEELIERKIEEKWKETRGPVEHHETDQYTQEREKGQKKRSEEIMAENFPNLMRDVSINTEETQQIESKMNSKRPTSSTLYLNFQKAKAKKQNRGGSSRTKDLQ